MELQISEETKECERIIKSLAYQFYKTIHPRDIAVDVEDLIQDGYTTLTQLLREKELKGTLKAPLPAMLSQLVRDWFKSKYEALLTAKRGAECLSLEEDMAINNSPRWNLSDIVGDRKEVADLILNAPTEFISLCRNMSLNSAISRYLIERRKWSPIRLKKFWFEIRYS